MSDRTMILILDGNLVIDAHIRSNLNYLIDKDIFFKPRAVTKLIFLSCFLYVLSYHTI